MSYIEVKKIRELASNNVGAKNIFVWWAGLQRSREESPIDRIANESRVDYKEVVYIMKELAELGAGKFLVGRRGAKSRFEFWCDRVELGKVALGQLDTIEAWYESDQSDTFVNEIIELHKQLLAKAIGVNTSKVKISCNI